MDPPPPPQPPPAPPTTATPPTTTTPTYADSLDSSPRSRTTDSYFDDPPPPSLSSKLRLMCSYGGRIVPRPHDKSLCYVGGDTRIVVVDRHTTLSSLSTRLSNTLLNGRQFTLKYQLPNEDLDSLISVTTDEDLDNMIEEYDRTSSNAVSSNNHTSNGNNRSLRLRLFLFPLKPDSSQSMGPILDSSVKSEDWFVTALNGGAALNRGFSDSATVNCLLGLDDEGNNEIELVGSGSGGGGVTADVGAKSGAKQAATQQGQDVHSVPDSPMLETTSSFGSTSSSPSLANLPPIRVHVEDGGGSNRGGGGGVLQDQKVMGIEEQFAQISVSGGGGGRGQDEGFVVLSSPPPMPVSIGVAGVPIGGSSGVVGEYQNRVVSDDERSDHWVPVGYRKPPAPQTGVPQSQQRSSGGGGGASVDLPSPDSVSSDSSFGNAMNRPKQMMYQDQVVQIPAGGNRVSANPVDPKINLSDPSNRIQIQQVQDHGYVLQPQYDPQQHPHQQQQLQPQYDPQQHPHQQQQLQPQYDQQQHPHQQQQLQPQYDPQQHSHQQQQPQQYIHAGGAHYIQHHPTGAMPLSAYIPVYPSQQQHHQHHHQLDQQYPVYYVQAPRQPQAYNLPVQQTSISEAAANIPSSRPQTPPNPTIVPSTAAYNAIRNAPVTKPEMAASSMYRTATPGGPQMVQVPSSQHQQQYVGYSQVHHPSQSVVPSSTGNANYAYEFADPAHAQIYYTQPLAPTGPSQYQTMTAAAAAVALPEASSQLPTDNIKQQIRTSQPI